MHVDVSRYQNRHDWRNKLGRTLWALVWLVLFRPSPRIFYGWRVFLLRLFGAKIGKKSGVWPTCRVWAPWNLEMGDYTTLGSGVDCYSVDKIRLGSHVAVSQNTFLCTATHDIADAAMALVTAPIRIQDGAWIAARAYVAPGVTVGSGAVVGACSVVTKDVEAWTVVAGNPARLIRKRVLRESSRSR